MATVHELLSRQFYDWELRGRGWKVFDEPVHPEPPFERFSGHYLPPPQTIDDGRVPTFFSSLIQGLSRKLSGTSPAPPARPTIEEEPPARSLERGALSEIQVSLPRDLNVTREAFEQFLLNLSRCREPISFEIVAQPGRITIQFAASERDIALLERQLAAHFPDAGLRRDESFLEKTWKSSPDDESIVVEFGLAREFFFPLANNKLDPFVGLLSSLGELASGESAVFQVLFEPVRDDWAESIENSVTHADGSTFFVDRPELVSAARNKIQRPLFAAVVRLGIKAQSFDRTIQIACDCAGSLGVFRNPQGNELIPLENTEYPFEDHIDDLLRRQSRRSGMLLTHEELMGFVHLPSQAVRSPILERETGKTKRAPASVQVEGGLLLGDNLHAQKSVPVRLTSDARVRHMHILGASGTGKSTLLFNLIRQDIENGQGLAVLDPHGDLIDRILGAIPPERISDVVLVDPSDEQFSVGFNILSAHSDLEKTLLASDLVSVFQRLSSSWGDQMGSVFQNAILAFLESDVGGTLSDLRRFLIEPAFRDKFLKSVRDPDIVYYWRKAFNQLSGNKSIGSVLTRLETFLAPKPIRYMVSQPANCLNFAHILDTGKIFLAKLPQGQMGKENAFLLGSLIVSKFQQMAMARQAQRTEARRDFWFYIDEFHNFITPSMTEILTGARKYRLGLVLAHQELRQLERDREVASAILSNTYTRVVFRVGDSDSRSLENGFSFFEAKDLQNLATGSAICRVERADGDFNLSVQNPSEEDPAEAQKTRQKAIEFSRTKYATPRAEVEKMLWEKLKLEETPPQPASAKSASSPLRKEPPPRPPEPPSDQNPLPTALVTKSVAPEEVVLPKKPVEVIINPPVLPAETPSVPVSVASPSVVKTVETETAASVSPAVKDMGIGGAQHQAIQQRIKVAAEKLGFGATIEKQILDRKGSVDILIEGRGHRIACEISITTTIDHEVGNVKKCLKAGLRDVAVICSSQERLGKIKKAVVSCLDESESRSVSYYEVEGFLEHLQTLARASQPVEQPILKLGKYKVMTKGATLTAEEAKSREAIAVKMMAETMKKSK